MVFKRSTPALVRLLCAAGATALITACSGGSNSSALPPQALSAQSAQPVASAASVQQPAAIPTSQASVLAAYSVVQSTQSNGTYNSTISISLPKAPAVGDVLVLFFEQNRSAAFPYSGQVKWPAGATGSEWSYDGGTSTTAILHHVVAAGETGQYTLNVGGTGSGFEQYAVAEVTGVNASNPLDQVAANTVAAGATQYSAGITPTTHGTLPLAFFSAHQGGHTYTMSSGWKIAGGNSGAGYSQMLAAGPAEIAVSPINATATLSSASGYAGAADVVLLNGKDASGSSTPTPTPSSDPTPTASPNSTPTPASKNTPTPPPVGVSSYTYHGCPVYAANDWFTTNLVTGGSSYVSNSVDPNSAAIIANLSNAFPGLYIDEAHPGGETTVNIATSSTPTYNVNGTTMINDPYNDDPNNIIPITNPLYEEGSASTSSCTGDCHTIVMTSPTSAKPCVDYETYNSGNRSWNGSTYTTGTGYVHNLNHALNGQYSEDGYVADAGGLPLLGMTDFGEDASASSINHIIEFSLPGSGAHPSASGGYVAPASAEFSCSTNCTNKLPLGARLRLRASYPCPSQGTNPQSYLICNQLKTYGMIFVDWNGSSGSGTSIMEMRFGTTTSGTNPWNGNDLYPGLKGITIGDFDVMTLGTIH